MESSERTKAANISTTTTAAPAIASTAAAEGATGQGNQEGRREAAPTGIPSGPMAIATPLEKRTISCLMNAHYHAGREAFLDTVHRWFMFFVIALGAAALMDALPNLAAYFGYAIPADAFKELCAAGAAILAGLDLTFDLSNRARGHAMMKRRYFELLAELRAGRKTADEVGVCLDQYSAEEEPPYKVLLLACWNSSQRTVFGDKAKQFDISLWGQFWKNMARRPTVTYPVVDISKT